MDIQYIDLGSGPGAGDSDSAYEAFSKTNHNFGELESAIAAMGGTASYKFTDLTDTPSMLFPYTIPMVNDTATTIRLLEFGSDSDIDPGAEDTIEFDYSNPFKIVIKAKNTGGSSPDIGSADIDMQGNRIVNTANVTVDAINDYNSVNSTSYSIDDMVVNKRFTDLTYFIKTNPIIMEGDQTAFSFVLNISNYYNGNATVSNHGLNSGYNGTPVIFTADSNTPGMLSNGGVYYIRYIDANHIALYADKATAITQNQTTAAAAKIQLTGSASGSNHVLTFQDYDSSLTGGYLRSQAVPREDVVLRVGDSLTGPLILHDHPQPFSGEAQTDDMLQGATRYFAEETAKVYANAASLKDRAMNILENGDIFCATGLHRVIVDNFTPGQWSVGQTFTVSGTSLKNGIIKDIKHASGSRYIVSFQSGVQLLEKDDIISNGIGTATVVDVFQEIAQSRTDATSNIEITVNRNSSAENIGSGSISNVILSIKSETITEDMLSPGISISQDNLDLNNAIIFDESDPTNGWAATNEIKESVIGLAAFSDENFEGSNGFIRIKPYGINLSEITTIGTNRLLGSTESNGGIIEELTYSYIIENGGGITESNLGTVIFDKFDSDIFEYSDDVLTIKDNGILASKLQNIDSGFVLGRTSSGFGQVEPIPISAIGGSGGISSANLSSEFNYTGDILSLNDNGVGLTKLARIPAKTVLGNSWSTEANVQTLPLSIESDADSVVYRDAHGAISSTKLKLNNKVALDATVDSLKAYVPTGQLVFTAVCGDACDFNHTETDFNGSVKAITFLETSDLRKKHDIQTISNALEKVCNLRGVSFKWNDTNEDAIGLIAQEVEAIMPSVVTTDSEGYKCISYTNLIGLLIESIKELNDQSSFTVPFYYTEGTVLSISLNPEFDLEAAEKLCDTKTAGIVKTSFVKHSKFQTVLYDKGKGKCKVLGTAKPGDLLVASAIPGYACVNNDAPSNCIIGKVLNYKNDDKKEIIDIMVV